MDDQNNERWKLLRGDCYEVLKTLPDNSIDAVVTDPPYGLSSDVDIRKVIRHWFVGKDYKHDKAGFMGAEWDSFVPGPEIWREVFRVLKPGGHLLAFTGSRTMDLMGFAIRFGGFEMRDTVMAWLYKTGKPKTLDVSKGIDAFFNVERKVIERRVRRSGGYHIRTGDDEEVEDNVTEPATPEAQHWDWWHTGIKPCFEPVLMARKPLAEDTVVKNVLAHGTGALNAGGCRLPPDPETGARKWPTNTVLCHHPLCDEGECHPDCAVAVLEHQNPGSAKSFPHFYLNGKAGKDDRYVYVECGCPEARVMPLVEANALAEDVYEPEEGKDASWRKFDARSGPQTRGVCPKCEKPYVYERHPTVKPTDVMRWLVRLVTPAGGVVLDPFNGSGSTGVAALHERMRYVGIEREEKFYEIASARLRDTAAVTPTYEPPPPLRGIDYADTSAPEPEPKDEVIPLPDSEALRKAFDITEEIKVERKAGGLAAKDFKRLVSKGLKR
jgi:site-specific DNA-methyltransferase (adenine-specific)